MKSKHERGLIAPSSGEDGELQGSVMSYYYYYKSQHVRQLDILY